MSAKSGQHHWVGGWVGGWAGGWGGGRTQQTEPGRSLPLQPEIIFAQLFARLMALSGSHCARLLSYLFTWIGFCVLTDLARLYLFFSRFDTEPIQHQQTPPRRWVQRAIIH